jgi:hypothetical protein
MPTNNNKAKRLRKTLQTQSSPMIPHFANNINNNNKMLAAPVEMGVG